MMLTKIDKKILILLVGALVVVALSGIAAYMRLAGSAIEVQNSAGGASTENSNENSSNEATQNGPQQNAPDTEIDLGDVQVEGNSDSGSGGLTICLDKCGDGICQTKDSECTAGSLNCVCLETQEECPQDCK